MNPSCPVAFAVLLAVGCASDPAPFQSPDNPSLTGKTTFPPTWVAANPAPKPR